MASLKKNCYRLHGLGNESLWEQDFPHLYNEYWVSSLGIEWLSHDINHLPPSSAKVKDRV